MPRRKKMDPRIQGHDVIKKEIKTELCRGCMYDAVCAGNDSGISPCPEFVEIPYCELCGTSHPNDEPCPPGPY